MKPEQYNCRLYKHIRQLGQFEFDIESVLRPKVSSKLELRLYEQAVMDLVPPERLLNDRRAVSLKQMRRQKLTLPKVDVSI